MGDVKEKMIVDERITIGMFVLAIIILTFVLPSTVDLEAASCMSSEMSTEQLLTTFLISIAVIVLVVIVHDWDKKGDVKEK